MATVKCIKIDSKNETLKFEYLKVHHELKRYREEEVLLKPNSKNAETVAIYFDDLTIEDPKELPKHGIFLWTQALQTRFKKKNYSDSKCAAFHISGDAIIVSFAENIVDGNKTGIQKPVDTTITLEDAARLVVMYSDGVETFLPTFTCMVAERPWEIGYEILLQLDRDVSPNEESDTRVRHLSPQLVTLALANRELTVTTGKISNLDEKVHVGIYESDRSDMRCIGSCTLAAHKISGWVTSRLKDFFFNQVIAEPFMNELNFRRHMEDMHRRLGIY